MTKRWQNILTISGETIRDIVRMIRCWQFVDDWSAVVSYCRRG